MNGIAVFEALSLTTADESASNTAIPFILLVSGTQCTAWNVVLHKLEHFTRHSPDSEEPFVCGLPSENIFQCLLSVNLHVVAIWEPQRGRPLIFRSFRSHFLGPLPSSMIAPRISRLPINHFCFDSRHVPIFPILLHSLSVLVPKRP
jgi:hypothetical protein